MDRCDKEIRIFSGTANRPGHDTARIPYRGGNPLVPIPNRQSQITTSEMEGAPCATD